MVFTLPKVLAPLRPRQNMGSAGSDGVVIISAQHLRWLEALAREVEALRDEVDQLRTDVDAL